MATPTTTPTRAKPGAAASIRAPAQRNGMIARRLMAGSWEGLRVRRTVYRLGRVGALTAVNNFPAVRFSQASAVTDLMPVGSHRAAGGLHAVLRQSRDGRALSRPHRNLTIDRGEVYSALNQAGPGNDINVGSSGSQKAPTWSPASLVAKPGCGRPKRGSGRSNPRTRRSSSPAETCPGPTTSEPTAPDQLGEGAAFRLMLPWPSLVSIPTWHLLLGYRRRALDKPFARVSSV